MFILRHHYERTSHLVYKGLKIKFLFCLLLLFKRVCFERNKARNEKNRQSNSSTIVTRKNKSRKEKEKKRENICDLRTYLRKKAFLKVTAFNCHSSKSEIKSKAVSPVR